MERKTFRLDVKEIDAKRPGSFRGYASVYGVRDFYDDIVVKGAFARTIENQKGIVPILSQHYTDIEIGLTEAMAEDDHGLLFHGCLYLDPGDPLNELPAARADYIRMKRRMEAGKPMGVSIGYETISDKKDGDARLLTEIKLWEISLVTFPANPEAMVSDVKGLDLAPLLADLKAGRKLSPRNLDVVKPAINSLQALLEAAQADDQAEGHASDGDDPVLAQLLSDPDMVHSLKNMVEAFRS